MSLLGSVAPLLVLAALAAGCASRATAPARPPTDSAQPEIGPDVERLTPESSLFLLRRSAVADQYFWLRAKALEGEAPPEFREPFNAIRELRDALGGDASAWEDLELPLGEALRASDLVAAYGALPERTDLGLRGGPLRAPAQRLARAMHATETAYRGGPYRAHADAVTRAGKELTALLVPNERALLEALRADMALPSDASRPLEMTLVGDAPYATSFAADDRGHAMATFVRVRGLEGAALAEVVLQAALHATDEMTVRAPTAMNTLRKTLAERGMDASDSNVEMAVNTVTFAEAASLVRRFVAPSHQPLGDSGFYELYPPARAIVDAWERHVAGAPLEETLDAIAAAVTEP
jgi:hypothetical protein